MTSNAPSQVLTAHGVAVLLPKLQNADPDLRFMALSDLRSTLTYGHPTFIAHDYSLCAKVVEALMAGLNDTNGEVQNEAIKCVGPFVERAPENIIPPMIDKISELKKADAGSRRAENAVDNSVPALALREIVTALPHPFPGGARTKAMQDAYGAISRILIPRLVGHTVVTHGRKEPQLQFKGLLENDIESGTDSNAIDVLIEVAKMFGSMLQDAEVQALQKVTLEVLDSDRANSVLKKKAVIATSTLAPYFSDSLLSAFTSRLIETLRTEHLEPSRKKLYVTIIGSLARSIPRKFGPYLKTLAPFVLGLLSTADLERQMEEDDNDSDDEEHEINKEEDEVREVALITLESLLASCTKDMRSYTKESLDVALRFLIYDPNFAGDDDDDDDAVDDFDDDDDEDYEADAAFDDDDDASWKVRRCAAKVLYTIIDTRGSGDLLDDGTMCDKVAPALITRFTEREENVRIEVLAALGLLMCKIGEAALTKGMPSGVLPDGRAARKRRAGSDASMFDVSTQSSLSRPVLPFTLPQKKLTELSSGLVGGAAKLLKTSPIATKQATLSLLIEYIATQRGGISSYLDQLIDSLANILKGGSSSFAAAAAAGNSLRIGTLQLLGEIAEVHGIETLQPYLPKIIPPICTAAKDRYSKVSVQALKAIEQYALALTPPNNLDTQVGPQLRELLETLVNRANPTISPDADTDVRLQAIRGLVKALAQCSGPSGQTFISAEQRTTCLDLLLDRIRNELTRLASINALEPLLNHATSPADVPSAWIREVCPELCEQLRKVSPALRDASMKALVTLASNTTCRTGLGDEQVRQFADALFPVLKSKDVQMIESALVILSRLVAERPKLIASTELDKALCHVVQLTLTESVDDAFLNVVRAVGQHQVGQSLMQALLRDVGIGGNAHLVGKAIGNLLVAGGSTIGVRLEDFAGELETSPDSRRKILALYVLGEAVLRMGPKSTLQPDLFIRYFTSTTSGVADAAAVSLGRAGAGNVAVYLPSILDLLNQRDGPKRLLLQSVREILQHKSVETSIIPFTNPLWENIVAAAQIEGNQTVGAECIGRLAIIDPKLYLPQLQTFLSNDRVAVRGMVIIAYRYIFSDTSPAYDANLLPTFVELLTTMLTDGDLENRRLGLTTLAAAARNKPDMVLPHLKSFLPHVEQETSVKPELVREVQMGPFKHRVDDGLELRKSAYETIYALMDRLSAYPRLSAAFLPGFFDRVVEGVADEHDIKLLSCLMLSKLIQTMGTDGLSEAGRRLGRITEVSRGVLAQKAKEMAVKQDVEKLNEEHKAVIKLGLQVDRDVVSASREASANSTAVISESATADWKGFWSQARKEFPTLLRAAEEELGAREGHGHGR